MEYGFIDSQTNSEPKPALGLLQRMVAMLRGATRPQTRALRCVEALQLGPKRSLYLVECDGYRFLAGAGSDGIYTLLPLRSPDGVHDRNGAATP